MLLLALARPRVPIETRELISRLARENRPCGAPRIQRELERLGAQVTEFTVSEYMPRYTGPPSPRWRECLRAEADGLLACGFFSITTANFKRVTAFVVMELGRQRILAVDVAARPTAE